MIIILIFCCLCIKNIWCISPKKRNSFHYDTEIDKIYLLLRFHCSKLKADQFKLNFVDNSKCENCNKNKQETRHHYFIDCTAYDAQRKIMKGNISKLHDRFKNITNRQIIQLIEGTTDSKINEKIYKYIYQFIKLYIVTTGRFI